jgi:hypothetical protein
MTPDERSLAAVLRGESSSTLEGNGAEVTANLLDAARYHGVVPLLAAEFAKRSEPDSWSAAIVSVCRDEALAQAMYELAHQAEMAQVIEGLTQEGLRPLLLKGTGLAYSYYPNPVLRPRADTDVLVPPEAHNDASRVLCSMGYRRVSGPAGKFVGYQLEFHRIDRLGARHNIDLHWRISNSQYFAWLFPFDELARSAVPVPRLHPLALRIGNVDALIVSLLHRASNNRPPGTGFGDRLIWHYDIHLIVEQMSDDEFVLFPQLVEAKRVAAIAIEGLRHCADRFRSPRLELLIERLAHGPVAESGAEFLNAGRLQYEWIEIRAIPGAGARMSYLAQRTFPAPDYMRERYPDAAGHSLPLLHARRILNALAKLRPARRP